jgi:type I restriction enzyme, S subunit
MITDLKPYPAMKDSGVEWLGEVPEHWEVLPGRACVFKKKEPNIGMVENTVLSLSYGRIVVKPKEKLRGLVPESFETYQVIDPGDVICRPTDLQNDRTSLRFGLAGDRGIITSAYICLGMQSRLNGRYGHQLLHGYDLKKIFYGFGSGLRQNLGWEDFKYLPFATPPLPEQTAIVRYLDHVDRRVRRLVRAKRKLIALLTEQKQAIIHRAVTRGLDPDVPLKDSGVEWLGEVPEHWEVTRFKRVAGVAGGLVDPRMEEQRNKTLIAPNHIERDGTARLLERETAEEQGADSGKYEVRAGEIIYCKIRPYLRKAVIAPIDCLCSADMYPIAVKEHANVTYDFLLLEMLSLPFTQYTIDCSLRAAMPKINREALGEASVWLPPLPEQVAISKHLTEATVDIDAAVSRANHEITLINEYRTRLIADVVTGKLDVREAAAELPDVDPLAAEDEPDDSLDIDSDNDTEADLDEMDAIPEEAEA